jgi:hypothetical protein
MMLIPACGDFAQVAKEREREREREREQASYHGLVAPLKLVARKIS